uniref:Endoplasmic reticulum transmembrane protein n=1 Tax=Salix viminalis TaxID=40686 RepID=A0A6N2KCH0_SALVM
MALQWMILTYLVAAEAAIATLLTLPSPKLLKYRLVSLISLLLQPAIFIVPFSGFQLLDIYWKMEHRLMCTGETCTAAERDHVQSSKECHSLHFSMPSLLVCLSYMQILQGDSELGGSREEVQGPVIRCHVTNMSIMYLQVYLLCLWPVFLLLSGMLLFSHTYGEYSMNTAVWKTALYYFLYYFCFNLPDMRSF